MSVGHRHIWVPVLYSIGGTLYVCSFWSCPAKHREPRLTG